jgi:hypothetical protein
MVVVEYAGPAWDAQVCMHASSQKGTSYILMLQSSSKMYAVAQILRRNWKSVRSAAAFFVYFECVVHHVSAQFAGHARHEARSERCSLHTSYLMQ